MLPIIFCTLLASSLTLPSLGQQCKNELGKPVDWFITYKPPILKGQRNYLLRKGLGYIYITSENSTSDWKLSSKSINDSSCMLAQTLAPLYKESAKNLFYILYNDEPPTSQGSVLYGHAKGVVISDGETGVWLVHSAPKFPIEPVTIKKINGTAGVKNVTVKNNYLFPPSSSKFGQSFLCMSLPPNHLNNVGFNLQFFRPKIYDANVPESMKSKFANLTEAANKKYRKRAPWTSKMVLKTVGRREFVSYAKAKEFNRDLYSDWLAPDLQSDLQVETWSNGPNELPSNCKTKYHVMDVTDVKIKAGNTTLGFKNSQDHSKWAITTDKNSSTVCIGDINRMLAQFKRGGGTVCYKNTYLWKKYTKAVEGVQPCTIVRPSQTEKPN